MDLHNIVENLHKGKKSISKREHTKILSLNEISSNDSELIGKHYSRLIEIKKILPKLETPNGFIFTSYGIEDFLVEEGIKKKIDSKIKNLKYNNIKHTSSEIIQIIKECELNELLKVQLSRAYDTLHNDTNFTQLKSKISLINNSKKELNLIEEIENIKIISSKNDLFSEIIKQICEFYNEHNLFYRLENKINNKELKFAIGFEIISNSKVSGIASSIDYNSRHESIISIHSSLCDFAYLGIHKHRSDIVKIFKNGIEEGKKGIFSTITSKKERYFKLENNSIVEKKITPTNKNKASLNENQINLISKAIIQLEHEISKKRKEYTPIKINFTISENNILKIQEVFFETKHLHNENKELLHFELIEDKNKIASGNSIGHEITHGIAKVITNEEDLSTITKEDIVITHTTYPHWDKYIQKAKGLVVAFGDEFSRCSAICYEHNILGLINAKDEIFKIKTGDKITLNCSNEIGSIHKGLLKYKIQHIDKQKNINKNPTIKILENEVPHNYLIKNNFPNKGRTNISCFENLNPELFSKKNMQQIIESNVEHISKIAISNYPQELQLSIGKNKHILQLLNAKKRDKLSNKTGIQLVIDEAYEEIFKAEMNIISKVISEVGCNNISISINNIQEEKEIIQFKELLSKYHQDSLKVFGVCSLGGIVLASSIAKHVQSIACDLNELKTSFGENNNLAISKFIHHFINDLSKNRKEIGICNITSKDHELIENIYHTSINIMSCKHNEILPIYSMLLELEENKKIKHKKHKKGIKIN